MGKELDIVNELIKLSWDVPDLNVSGAGFLGLQYFTLRLLQRVVQSLCLLQEGGLPQPQHLHVSNVANDLGSPGLCSPPE